GISILHSSYLHTKTPCEVILKIPGGQPQTVAGKIIRCEHIQGRVHEIGIKFTKQISTKDLLGLDPLNEAYSLERVEPSRLHGSVLIVTASDFDRELLLMFLEDTNLAVNTADSIENAVARAQKGCDLIISDYYLGGETGPDLIRALQAAGSDMPVVVLIPDKTEKVLDEIREARAAGVLSKPTTKDRLLQALGEFLHADGDGGPLYSSLASNDSAYPLLCKFLTDIPRMALTLEQAVRDNDAAACSKIIRTLSGTASPLGFPSVSTLALAADRKLTDGTLKGASPEIRALILACRRMKAKPAA
ncbi:MAG: response regulator, partial [Phycisphaerales bacterium]